MPMLLDIQDARPATARRRRPTGQRKEKQSITTEAWCPTDRRPPSSSSSSSSPWLALPSHHCCLLSMPKPCPTRLLEKSVRIRTELPTHINKLTRMTLCIYYKYYIPSNNSKSNVSAVGLIVSQLFVEKKREVNLVLRAVLPLICRSPQQGRGSPSEFTMGGAIGPRNCSFRLSLDKLCWMMMSRLMSCRRWYDAYTTEYTVTMVRRTAPRLTLRLGLVLLLKIAPQFQPTDDQVSYLVVLVRTLVVTVVNLLLSRNPANRTAVSVGSFRIFLFCGIQSPPVTRHADAQNVASIRRKEGWRSCSDCRWAQPQISGVGLRLHRCEVTRNLREARTREETRRGLEHGRRG